LILLRRAEVYNSQGVHGQGHRPQPLVVTRVFLDRTAPISSVPTESSHTARAAMLGRFVRHLAGSVANPSYGYASLDFGISGE
jgi:hypothetical protein